MSLDEYIHNKGIHIVEGYSQQIPLQINDLKILAKNAKTIMEIGFNGGHSSQFFLELNPLNTVLSFDLGLYDCVAAGKEYIDSKFPGRHRLILGDSTQTVPAYIKENPDVTFDFIFIDGGHDYPVAKADLDNCRLLATKDTLVAIDDTIFTRNDWIHFYNEGPTKAWQEGLKNGLVTQIHSNDYDSGRGMSWGRYL